MDVSHGFTSRVVAHNSCRCHVSPPLLRLRFGPKPLHVHVHPHQGSRVAPRCRTGIITIRASPIRRLPAVLLSEAIRAHRRGQHQRQTSSAGQATFTRPSWSVFAPSVWQSARPALTLLLGLAKFSYRVWLLPRVQDNRYRRYPTAPIGELGEVG